MEGNPTQFEAIGNRLGFRILEETDKKLSLVWQGPRFPAFLCLGIALLLLSVSLPILYAIYLNGFVGAAGSLWYFPLMNLILFGISLYLLSQKRTIIIDNSAQQVTLKKRSLYQTTLLSVAYLEITTLKLGVDQVTPLVAWLVHESNEDSGEVYTVGGGRVAKIFVAEGPGYGQKETLSVEDVRDNWAAINAKEPLTVFKNVGEQMGPLIQQLTS